MTLLGKQRFEWRKKRWRNYKNEMKRNQQCGASLFQIERFVAAFFKSVKIVGLTWCCVGDRKGFYKKVFKIFQKMISQSIVFLSIVSSCLAFYSGTPVVELNSKNFKQVTVEYCKHGF